MGCSLVWVVALLVVSVSGAPMSPQWKLVWSEEFNDISPNKWQVNTTDTNSLRYGILDGKLIFSDDPSYNFTKTGVLNSMASFTFGRLEFAIQAPYWKEMDATILFKSLGSCIGSNQVLAFGVDKDLPGDFTQVGVAYNCCGKCDAMQINLFPSDENLNNTIWVDYMPDNVTWYLDGVEKFSLANNRVRNFIDPAAHFLSLSAIRQLSSGDAKNSTIIMDYIRFYAYEPCAKGCQNGCCDNARQICLCDKSYSGSQCEFNLDGYNHSFAYNNMVVGQLDVSCYTSGSPTRIGQYAENVNYNNTLGELQLSVTTNPGGAPCNSATNPPVVGGTWGVIKETGYGTYEFRAKAANSIGAGLNVHMGYSDSASYYSYQIVFYPYNTTAVQVQYFNGTQAYSIQFIPLPNGATFLDFHTYSISITPTQSSYAMDGITFFTKVEDIQEMPYRFFAKYEYNPDWYHEPVSGSEVYPKHVSFTHFAFTPACDDEYCKLGACLINVCGDGYCTLNETARSCPQDCIPVAVCGDGVCSGNENCTSCQSDCCNCQVNNGNCGLGAACRISGQQIICSCPVGYVGNPYIRCNATCGDGFCNATIAENCNTCLSDCGLCDTNKPCPGTPECSGHGTCRSGLCICDDPARTGSACEQAPRPITVEPPPQNKPTPKINVTTSETRFQISLVSIREVDKTGTEAAFIDVQNQVYKLTSNTSLSGYTLLTVRGNLTNRATLEVSYYFFTGASTISFAGRNMSYSANQVKFNIKITNWPFRQLGNQLKLIIANSNQGDNNCLGTKLGTEGDNLRWIQIQLGNVSLYGRFSEYSVIDGTNNFVKTVLEVDDTKKEVRVAIVVPYFWTSAEIDPDFSVLLATDAPQSSQANCNLSAVKKKGGVSTPVVLGVTLGVVGAVLVAAAILFVVLRQKRMRSMSKLSSN